MENISELLTLGYSLENYENLLIRIKNSYNDTICTVYFRSGFINVPNGKIFNYKREISEGMKKHGNDNFLKLN
jgi:hypothetical protein